MPCSVSQSSYRECTGKIEKKAAVLGQIIDFIGGCRRTRTFDPLIKSQLLYQLSYTPIANGPTTHLVRPRRCLHTSPKVDALASDERTSLARPSAECNAATDRRAA